MKKYNNNHLMFYLEKVDLLNVEKLEINEWVKTLSTNDLKIWLRVMTLLESDNFKFQYYNLVIAVTFIIKLFLIELHVDLTMVESFDKKFKIEIIDRFDEIIRYELYRRKFKVKMNNKYTLLTKMGLIY